MHNPVLVSSLAALLALASAGRASAQSLPATLPDIPWRLTARPWTPANQPRAELLDRIAPIASVVSTFQYWNAGNASDVRNGEITDPYKGSEWQYATPFFAFYSAALLADGRNPELITAAIRAMDHTTADIAGLDNPGEDGGHANDDHGEFIVAPMAKALRLFKQMRQAGLFPNEITPALIQKWETRMGAPRASYMALLYTHNWITYASKGEWLRAQDGLIDKTEAVNWIENNWTSYFRARLTRDQTTFGLSPYFYMWHDDDPGPRQNFAYNAGATGNLTDMLENGYDGPSRADMSAVLAYTARSCLLLMAGSGDAPAGARTGDHVWNDIVYGNLYDRAAERAWAAGDTVLAGRFRRAAMLAMHSAWRYQQERGTYSVTKNNFHPSLSVHYADWSALTNYNGYTALHVAESFLNRKTAIPEQPTPAEIGGYAVTLDSQFGYSFLNAGGLQVQLCTIGATLSNPNNLSGSQLWHTLGIQRFSRPGWDSRLGPGDSDVKPDLSQAVSFSPTFLEGGVWKSVAQLPNRFVGAFTAEFAHPLLVRGTLRIAPRSGQTGPTFDLKLTVTPDGVLVDTTRSGGGEAFGLVWPVLTYDGKYLLENTTGPRIATTAYPRFSTTAAVLQAESATLTGGTATTSAASANNGAYATFPTTGGVVAWTGLNGGDGGPTSVGFRYSLATAATAPRTMVLRVNGQTRTLSFDSTRTAADWHQLYIPVTLMAGATNSVSLESNGSGGVNLDELRVHPASASTPEPDQQAFIALDAAPVIDATGATLRASFGDLRPVRVTGGTDLQSTLVYPRTNDDPSAASVQASFVRTANGFTTALGRIDGDLYVGRTSAGGRGAGIDLNNDGSPDVTFSQSCDFVIHLEGGQPSAIETDRAVQVTVAGETFALAAHAPTYLSSFVVPNAGPDLAVTDTDADQAESITLDATASVIREGAVTRYSWWLGNTFLGAGSTLTLDFPRGVHAVTLRIEHSSGQTFTDALNVTVNPTALPAGGAVLYRELFGRAATGNEVLANAGWLAYGGANGAEIAGGNAGFTGDGPGSAGQASPSNLAALPAVNSGAAATHPNNGRAFIFSDRFLAYTTEYVVNRAAQPVTTITWDQRGAGPALSAAVRIGGAWYVSAPVPNPNPADVWNTASANLATASWSTLAFTAGSTLGIGSATTLPAGDITAFGLYCASGGGGGVRIDGFTINGVADTNGLSDAWEIYHLGATGALASADPNGDGVPLSDDFILGNDPAGPNPPVLRFTRTSPGSPQVVLDARAAFGPGYQGKIRKFHLLTSTTLAANDWQTVPGYSALPGDNLAYAITLPAGEPRRFYRAEIWLE